MLHIRKKYIDILIKIDRRDKVRAFFEYRYDLQTDNIQSLSVYSKEWGIGRTTAFDWVSDFKANGVEL